MKTWGFNEAAAHHRGELLRRAGCSPTPADASMRPRLITAENCESARSACRRRPVASMRPRLITAENARQRAHTAMIGSASMRPRLITAENGSDTLFLLVRGSKLQ